MPAHSRAQASAAERVPVIVELFTSEGCSSCPPADDVLTKLVAAQPVANAEIIALGEHVDYWDRLGWRDPFSSAAFTARQSEYAAKAFGTGNIYTPQLIVDGREALVGSDYRAATAAISRAAASGGTAAARLRISVNAEHNPSRASVHVITRVDARDASVRKPAADMFLAIVEDGLVTQVKRGENQGRELRHTAVVRSLTPLGAMSADSAPWSADTTIRFPPDWNAARSRVVAFVQERAKRKMLGAAAANLTNKVS